MLKQSWTRWDSTSSAVPLVRNCAWDAPSTLNRMLSKPDGKNAAPGRIPLVNRKAIAPKTGRCPTRSSAGAESHMPWLSRDLRTV